MPVSDQAKEALFLQETGEVFLEIITITAEGLDPIRVVNNTQDIISGGQVYRASRFKVRFPSGKIGSSTKATIEISNVDRRPVEVVRKSKEPITLSAALIKASTPDVIEQGPFEYTLRQTRWVGTSLSADLIDDADGNIAIPRLHYNSQDFPALY